MSIGEGTKPRTIARVTLRKFDGDDQTKEPLETIVLKDDDFTDEMIAAAEENLRKAKEKQNATD